MMYRQGDIFMVSVAAVPGTAKPRPTRRLVIARGEATGHAHVLERPAERGATAQLLDNGRDLYARIVGGSATVTHEEHGAIMLPPGEYQIVHQREFVPAQRGMPSRERRVID